MSVRFLYTTLTFILLFHASRGQEVHYHSLSFFDHTASLKLAGIQLLDSIAIDTIASDDQFIMKTSSQTELDMYSVRLNHRRANVVRSYLEAIGVDSGLISNKTTPDKRFIILKPSCSAYVVSVSVPPR
ncbi:MAG: hypothetical protein Salg2KO_06170 [Salibacteraceae bacterium]